MTNQKLKEEGYSKGVKGNNKAYVKGIREQKRRGLVALNKFRQKAKAEVIEEVEEGLEKIFDVFRSSNHKKWGKRIFGIANFDVGAKDLHKDIFDYLTKLKKGGKK